MPWMFLCGGVEWNAVSRSGCLPDLELVLVCCLAKKQWEAGAMDVCEVNGG